MLFRRISILMVAFFLSFSIISCGAKKNEEAVSEQPEKVTPLSETEASKIVNDFQSKYYSLKGQGFEAAEIPFDSRLLKDFILNFREGEIRKLFDNTEMKLRWQTGRGIEIDVFGIPRLQDQVFLQAMIENYKKTRIRTLGIFSSAAILFEGLHLASVSDLLVSKGKKGIYVEIYVDAALSEKLHFDHAGLLKKVEFFQKNQVVSTTSYTFETRNGQYYLNSYETQHLGSNTNINFGLTYKDFDGVSFPALIKGTIKAGEQQAEETIIVNGLKKIDPKELAAKLAARQAAQVAAAQAQAQQAATPEPAEQA